MSFLGDNLDFEGFNLSDIWGKIKDNPEQLLLGAGTPIGAKLWGEILGKDYEPMVNVLGGPMGSGFMGLGSGGVYNRAQAEGINTKSAIQMHDLAEVIAGTMGIGGAIGGISNIGSPAQGTAQTYPYNPEQLPAGGYEIDAAGNPVGGGGGGLDMQQLYRMAGNQLNSMSDQYNQRAMPQANMFARGQRGSLTTGQPAPQEKGDENDIAMANAMLASKALEAMMKQSPYTRGGF